MNPKSHLRSLFPKGSFVIRPWQVIYVGQTKMYPLKRGGVPSPNLPTACLTSTEVHRRAFSADPPRLVGLCQACHVHDLWAGVWEGILLPLVKCVLLRRECALCLLPQVVLCRQTLALLNLSLHVSIAVVDLLQELTDIDTLHESEEGAEVLIDALVSSAFRSASLLL